jgi:hypothetical protein
VLPAMREFVRFVREEYLPKREDHGLHRRAAVGASASTGCWCASRPPPSSRPMRSTRSGSRR